jgi:hypothetical protein
MLNTTSAMTILSDGDACTAATEPCMCETTTIGDGETCTFVPPFGEID